MPTAKLVAKAVLMNDEGKILILRRSETDRVRPGELDLPGGGVDENESYEDAAQREIREEAGLDVSLKDLHLVFTDTNYYEGSTTIRFLYAAKLSGDPEIRLSYEHDEFAWMTFDEVEKLYNHPVWVRGMKYAAEHGLLPAEPAKS